MEIGLLYGLFFNGLLQPLAILQVVFLGWFVSWSRISQVEMHCVQRSLTQAAFQVENCRLQVSSLKR